MSYCRLHLARERIVCRISLNEKLERLESTNSSSMRVSNRIVPPSEYLTGAGAASSLALRERELAESQVLSPESCRSRGSRHSNTKNTGYNTNSDSNTTTNNNRYRNANNSNNNKSWRSRRCFRRSPAGRALFTLDKSTLDKSLIHTF